MKLVSVDETKGWQYTKDGERIMLELPQEKKLVDPNTFMKKSGGVFTGDVILASYAKLQAQSALSPTLDRFDLIKRNEKGYVEVGNSQDGLHLSGSSTRPQYNSSLLALLSDIPRGSVTIDPKSSAYIVDIPLTSTVKLTILWNFIDLTCSGARTYVIDLPITYSDKFFSVQVSSTWTGNWERMGNTVCGINTTSQIWVGFGDDGGGTRKVYYQTMGLRNI